MTWNVGALQAQALRAAAAADPVGFWETAARRLTWRRPWDVAHTWSPARPDPDTGRPGVPSATWFAGGRLNAAVNCVDRHVDAGRGRAVAVRFEGADDTRRTLTYLDLQRDVARAAHALTGVGVRPGDRVVIHLPVLPETLVAVLAAARVGATASLVFAGLSAEAVRHRIADVGARVVVTSDGRLRAGSVRPMKSVVDAAVADLPVDAVVVVRRTGTEVTWTERDVWWHDVVDPAPDVHEPAAFDAEHPLLIVHTSGTTGRPKGLVHTTGGYLTQASWTHWAAFDARPGDVHWCTADLAWVTGHTYGVYGPLSNGVAVVLDERGLGEGDPQRPARIIDRYRVTSFYTAPTVIRALARTTPDGFDPAYDLSSIRVLGSVGEPINPDVWRWYRTHLGSGTAPVVDTWWQSETGAAMIASLPGCDDAEPGSAGHPLPGVEVAVVDDDGEPVPPGTPGLLVIGRPWPGMARSIWGDPERYRDTYTARFAERGLWLTGDGAVQDRAGRVRLLGRVDEVVNVSGHRLSTIEVESALVSHPDVSEAGVTGVADPLTGQAIAAFVVPAVPAGPVDDAAAWAARTDELAEPLRRHVAAAIGPVARPRDLIVVPDLPRTRSGKILRRLLGDVHAGRPGGDTTSLLDPTVITRIAALLALRTTGTEENVA